MKQKNHPVEPELSRPLRVEKISANGVDETIIADARERKALAERFDLVEIKNLKAVLKVTPKQSGLHFEVTGTFHADLVQRCVVTLDPLPATVKQDINLHVAAPELIAQGLAERTLEEEDLEPIQNGMIDLGEVVAQHLGLSLDPYPRKPGLPPVQAEFGTPAVETNPFAKLVVLKDRAKD